jgi:hypothetical protein
MTSEGVAAPGHFPRGPGVASTDQLRRFALKRPNLQLAAALVVALASFGILIWAARTIYAHGVRAGEMGNDGTAAPFMSTWLLGSFVVLGAAAASLRMLLRRSGVRRRVLAPSTPRAEGVADAETEPWIRKVVDYLNFPEETRSRVRLGRWAFVIGVLILIALGVAIFAVSLIPVTWTIVS